MTLSGKLAYIILLISFLFTSNCSLRGVNQDIMNAGEARHFIPKFMRDEIFTNMPTRKMNPNEPFTDQERIEAMKRSGYNTMQKEVGAGDDDAYGDYNYGAGFEDGCQTITAVIGAGTMRLMKPKIDGYRLSEDPWYLRGFQDALSYCTFNLDWETH